MENLIENVVLLLVALAGSGGLWSYLQKRRDKKDAKTKMIMGIAHDRIIFLCLKYLDLGEMTPEEYENLYDYLYVPYHDGLNGNGTAKTLMEKVQKEVKIVKYPTGSATQKMRVV